MSNWSEKFSSLGVHNGTLAKSVNDNLVKARFRPQDPDRAMMAITEDPMAISYAMGYKDRSYSIAYEILKRIPSQLSIISAIIQTRCNQVGSFCTPYRLTKSIGYEVRHRNPGRQITPGDREKIQSIEKFIYTCGAEKPNPYSDNRFYRDDFETYLKKITRDSLTYDQACTEVVPSRNGLPYEFLAVDASTIRIAAPKNRLFDGMERRDRPFFDDDGIPMLGTTLQLTPEQRDFPAYVQVVNGKITNVFTKDDLLFGVRNPRTDLQVHGYGYSELEMLIHTITSHLFAEDYNRRFFLQGSAPRGILNFKGDAMSPEMLENFRRQWRANLEGVQNSWRTPILQNENDIQWIDLQKSNADMEYGAWLEYLIKLSTSVYLIDPAELNFDLSGGVSQTPLFESSQEWKLKASRDRGLKPLLRFIAKMINNGIVAKIDDNFVFDFVGLDELTEQEKHQLYTEQLSSYMTLNEIRRAMDLPDQEGGDIVLNPTFIQSLATMATIKQQEQTMAQQEEQQAMAQQQPQHAAPGQESEQSSAPSDQVKESTSTAPSYTGAFFKALTSEGEVSIQADSIAEIEYDDSWIDLLRGS